MSRSTYIDPYYRYFQLLGTTPNMAMFVPRTGTQQSITGNNAIINATTYHSKIYSTDQAITMTLANGRQEGQSKLITFTHKGNEDAIIRINSNSFAGDSTQITMSEVGDQIQLIWAMTLWHPLVTLNTRDPSSQTPRID